MAERRGARQLGVVLLVDDDILFLRAMARSFAPRAERVVTASDGSTALAMARSVQPDLIVLDFMLGDRSAFDVIEDLRADAAKARLVLLSGEVSPSEAAEAVTLGAHHVLVKPASVDALLAASAHRRRPPPEMPLDATLEEVEILHVKRVLAACRGNISETARQLGIGRRTLQRILDRIST